MEKKKKINKFTFNFNQKKFNFFFNYINILTKVGHKHKMEIGFFNILRNLKKEKNTYILTSYLVKAINEARPVLTLISKKKGGKVYKIPVSISVNREVFQALQWTIKETCGRNKGNYKKLLLKEFLNLSLKIGNAVRAKKILYKIAKKNRIYITKYYLK
jgi:ribosomal protein S7